MESRLKRAGVIIGRWLAILPVVPLVYVISKFLSQWGWGYVDTDFIYEIREYGSLEGHWIIGSIFTFQTEAVAVGFAIVAGVKTSPAFRLQVAILLSVLATLYVIVGSIFIGYAAALMEYSAGNIGYLVVATLGTVAGIAGGVYYLYDEGELTSRGHKYYE